MKSIVSRFEPIDDQDQKIIDADAKGVRPELQASSDPESTKETPSESHIDENLLDKLIMDLQDYVHDHARGSILTCTISTECRGCGGDMTFECDIDEIGQIDTYMNYCGGNPWCLP